MEIVTQGNRRVLVASEGHILQSVTDGMIIGKKIILGKKDSEIHYHEIPDPEIVTKDSEE